MDLAKSLPLIPAPRKMKAAKGILKLDRKLAIVLAEGADEEDRFAAEYLVECLKADCEISAEITSDAGDAVPVKISRGSGKKPEGYKLSIAKDGVEISGNDAAGVYYATQTLRQCVVHHGHFLMLPCVEIEDWPDLKHRAAHYDTKHHQDKYEYVKSFIRELAHYKVNCLVWEWEDKFVYPSHPEIGAPGAFTLEQMQELTRYARRHHVQIIPLVQGLGHVAFILKHLEFRHLREIPDSDWEFCPLKDGSYELLFDLWRDSMEATPGSEFCHIGSDETYELGLGTDCGCAAKAAEIGKDGLMQIFVSRCVEFVESQGRKCLSWGGRWKPGSEHVPPKGMVFVDSGDPEYLAAANAAGYKGWIYAPNPGIEPLIMTNFPFYKHNMWRPEPGQYRRGTFADTALTIGQAARDKSVEGSITTSWDDSGLHNQMWVPRFICAGEFSWNSDERDLDEWADRFLASYFGPKARHMRECLKILQDSAQFFEDTLQRRVWHWGDIGKVHVPDFPRAGLEYNNFWRRRYNTMLQRARDDRPRLDRAVRVLKDNLERGVRRAYDLEIMLTCADLMLHNIDLIEMLAEMEARLSQASDRLHFTDRKAALGELRAIEKMIEEHLADRERVYKALVECWERTRLPKGMSTKKQKYFFSRKRARHFANRTPDMRYLVLDEDLLDLEGYLARLKEYNKNYEREEIGK